MCETLSCKHPDCSGDEQDRKPCSLRVSCCKTGLTDAGKFPGEVRLKVQSPGSTVKSDLQCFIWSRGPAESHRGDATVRGRPLPPKRSFPKGNIRAAKTCAAGSPSQKGL